MEEVRLALLSSEGAIAHLAALLGHAEEWVRTAAAAALGNLAACRSDFQDAAPQVSRTTVLDQYLVRFNQGFRQLPPDCSSAQPEFHKSALEDFSGCVLLGNAAAAAVSVCQQ